MTDPDSYIRLSSAQKLHAVYRTYLERYPLFTRAITSAALFSSSDALSQAILKLRGQRSSFQFKSIVASALCGLVVCGPVANYFQKFLESYIPDKEENISYVKRYSIDRIAFAPVYLFLLLYFLELSERHNPVQAWSKVKSIYLNALLKNCVVYPGLQATNMLVIPIEYHFVFANLAIFIWNIYLGILRRL